MSFIKAKDLDKIRRSNKYNLTEKNLIKDIKKFPLGVVIRMMEEQEKQGNKPDVTVFQEHNYYSRFSKGFDWDKAEKGEIFWDKVINDKDFDLFFEMYPEYLDFK